MSALSRGGAGFARQPLLRTRPPSAPGCQSAIFSRPPGLQFFSSRPALCKTAKKGPARKSAVVKPSAFKAAAPLPAATPPPKTYQSFTSVLALRSSPTLLYQAPSHAVYIFGSYAFGAFCLAYAGYNFNAQYLHAPPGLAAWVPVAFGGVCFAMACMGSWLVLGPSRLIKAIHAIPSTLSKTPSSSPLLIRIDLRRAIPLPFLPPRSILVPSTSISLSAPLYIPPPAPLTPAQRREAIAQEARQREIERTKILTAPFRHFWYFLKRVMHGLVRVWSREGFVKVKIDGKAGVWRIDREGGWMLDEGRGIDRVVKGKAYSGGLISAA